MLDDELKTAISAELPKDVPHVFISAVTQTGLQELKDILWEALISESNRIPASQEDEEENEETAQ
jgi:GTP-binding protein